MGQMETATAFARAMETADCETLIAAIGEWFDKPYRDPTNALDIAVCVQSASHSFFARKIEDARKNWRVGEAAEWESSRIAFDNAMRAAVEALGKSPEAEITPQHDATPSKWGSRRPATAGASPPQSPRPSSSAWGDPSMRPAIGAGWGRPTAH